MIERRVRLEYSLVSYLFFIVVEVLNSIIMIEANLGIVRKIQPIANLQQIMAQYANDTSLKLLGEETNIQYVMYIIEIFFLRLDFLLNSNKSSEH